MNRYFGGEGTANGRRGQLRPVPPIEKSEWLASWGEGGVECRIRRLVFGNLTRRLGAWAPGGCIWVFKDSDKIEDGVVECVMKGMRDTLGALNLNLNVEYRGIDEGIRSNVRQSIDKDRGRIDFHQLSELLFESDSRDESKGGTQHADVIITDKLLMGDLGNWGYALFGTGSMVLSLFDETRRNALDKVRLMTMHETCHLLGFDYHHDSVRVNGYEEPDDCLMYGRVSTDILCERDRDAIQTFWKVIRDEEARKRLKR